MKKEISDKTIKKVENLIEALADEILEMDAETVTSIVKRVDYPELGYYINSESRGHGTRDIAYSIIDDGYIGDETWIKTLITDRGIRPQKDPNTSGEVCCIGKSVTDGKWYGWSHRALFGFEIGSEVKFGDCAYVAPTADEWGKTYMEFFTDKEWEINRRYESDVKWNDPRVSYPDKSRGELGVLIQAEYTNDVPNAKLHGTTYKTWWPYPKVWGKGEWTAKTEEDAKQMACDFAEGVN